MLSKLSHSVQTQKTICKHVLDPFYLHSFVEDPSGCVKVCTFIPHIAPFNLISYLSFSVYCPINRSINAKASLWQQAKLLWVIHSLANEALVALLVGARQCGLASMLRQLHVAGLAAASAQAMAQTDTSLPKVSHIVRLVP
jgi:hypothetical protein